MNYLADPSTDSSALGLSTKVQPRIDIARSNPHVYCKSGPPVLPIEVTWILFRVKWESIHVRGGATAVSTVGHDGSKGSKDVLLIAMRIHTKKYFSGPIRL